MSQKGHSTLLDQAFALEGLLDFVPDARIGIVHGQQQPGLIGNIFEIAHQLTASLAGTQMGFLFCIAASLNDVGQGALEFLAIHFYILSRLQTSLVSTSGGLFGFTELQQVAQLHARLVQL